MISVVSRDAAQTALIAGAIASVARPRDIIVLSGPMGAGKTAFTRGFADAVGVGADEHVSSPTFTLVHEYVSGRHPVHHADLYRTNSLDEIADLTLDEMVALGGVAVVEWGEMGDALWPSTVIRLSIDPLSETDRSLTVELDPARTLPPTMWSPA